MIVVVIVVIVIWGERSCSCMHCPAAIFETRAGGEMK